MGRITSFGGSRFNLRGQATAHVRIRVTARTLKLLRKHRSGVLATLTAVVGGKTVSQTIRLKIF